jgi:phosphatidylserine/phosphatidylglycerophosphate/cardiolipin synthase-like enzyme
LDILASLADSGVDIRIICSSPSMGFLDEMEGHEDLKNNPHFSFKTCRRCHMKMVIIDSELIYVGSANITAAGMGPRIDTRRNFEAGMISSDVNLVEQGIDIFEESWAKKRCGTCYYKHDCK